MTAQAPHRPAARVWLAVAISAAVLAIAIAAGARISAAAPGPLIFTETVSARISGLFLLAGTKAPLGYALVAGMVAAVNPCGFVLLPGYLGYYLGDGDRASGRRRTGRALLVSAVMTASFALLFGLVGILAGLAAAALTSALPWIGAAVGAGLIVLGGLLAVGAEPHLPAAPRAAQHLQPATRNRGLGGYAAYGTAYGLASLGCTLPLFLGVVGTSLQLHGLASAVGQFMLFGIGMGVVLTACTIATAWIGDGLIKRARVLGRHIGWVSAVALWLTGAYVLYYWLTAIRL
ncbi:MAG TPA: cytochrome c biogenesis protein CcdA [Streptosporangiaceae bacterium]|nr:cytochrome c biogenesis protein CcdA [Streptosporangiaceae bacterium]